MHTPIKKSWAEPYKIKMVELLKMTTKAQRKKLCWKQAIIRSY